MPEKRKIVRTRSGCLTCRRKRRKCDEQRPTCANCSRTDDSCEWGLRLSFRSENAQGITEGHPSMQCEASNKKPRKFEIMNVTSEIVRDYWNETGLPHHSPSDITRTPESDVASIPHSNPRSADADHQTVPRSVTSNPQDSGQTLSPQDELLSYHGSEHFTSPSASPHTARLAPILSPHSVPGYDASINRISPSSPLQTSPTAEQLSSLHHASSRVPVMIHGTSVMPNSYLDDLPIYDDQLGDLFDDGIFRPGSTYQELHTTLRKHIHHTARSNIATRHTTPDNVSKSSGLTQYEEYELWKNYVDEVAPGLDKFDNQCHFGHKLPPLAQSHPHLRYSILALSARQIELQHHRPSSGSCALYQEAIHLLLPELQTKHTAVIASCVVLCVLEMMSCSPKGWRRHLDGCASLFQAVDINGFAGGLEEALFWCFARMDVWGGATSSDRTLIPISKWASKSNLNEDVRLFRESTSFDTYANFVVYLCGQVMDLFASRTSHKDEKGSSYADRWLELFEHIEDWYFLRPVEMEPIVDLEPAHEDYSKPFPTLFFCNPPAISGNQMYHTAALLMLQNRPPGVHCRRKPKSILWHARRICAISISNTHHGCWTNSIQPIYFAGRVMSHRAEHRAILDLYEKVQQETGWETQWRAEDLRELWGDMSE